MKYYTLIFTALLVVFCSNLFSQEQPTHEQKYYTDEDGNFYFNRNQPLYFWISTSPTDAKDDVLLQSETTPQYANPMYLDSDGYNTMRISPAVNNITKKVDYPTHDLRFEIGSDGTAPATKQYFSNSKKYVANGKKYYGKGLEIKLISKDEVSGLDKIYYSLNGEKYQPYTSIIEPDNENENIDLKFYAVDNLGNVEKIRENNFALDMNAPVTIKKINGDTFGNILSQDATILLEAQDNMSGVKAIYYIIDDGKSNLYTKPISAYAFMGGEHRLSFYAIDNVGNSSFGDLGENTNSNFSMNFTVDKTAPTVDFEIIGDQHKGNSLFVSNRTKFNITSKDNVSDIEFIKFSYNSEGFNIYENESPFLDKSGYQTIKYYSQDVVENTSNISKTTVFLDKTAPDTYIDYGKPQFFHRDTLFINKETQIKLFSNDGESGVQQTDYSINNNGFVAYENSFKIAENGLQIIEFKATDKVNNVEQTKKSIIFVDNEPPEIYVNFSIEPIRQEAKNGINYSVYPPYSKMYLSATDKNTGEEDIYFSINEGKLIKYYSANNITKLISKEQFYTVKIVADDKLGNKSEKTINFFIAKK